MRARHTSILFLILLLTVTAIPASARKKQKDKHEATPAAAPLRCQLTAEQTLLFDSLYFDAIAQNTLGRTERALDLVSEALKVDSLSAPALFLRSRLYRLGQNPLSLADAEKAAAIDSTNYWYGIELGDQYMERGRFDLAIPCIERVQRLHPQNSEPCYMLADLYLRAQKPDLCLNMLDKIEELDGMNQNITLHKFDIMQRQGRSDDAFAEYNKLIKRFPYEISYRIKLGDLQMKYGQIPEAKKTYDEAARIDADNAYLWIAQSNYYSITGNQEAADVLVQNALLNQNLDIKTKIDILTEYLKNTLALVFKEKQNTKDSTAINLPGVDSLFISIATMHPTSPEVYDLHADYLGAIDQDSLAATQMKFAVDLRPSDRKYWGKYLMYLAQAGEKDEVLAAADEAKSIVPSLPEIYETAAWAHYSRNEYREALDCYEEELRNIDHNNASLISTIYGNIGDLYYQLGDKEKVYENMELSLKYNDKNYGVLNNYAYYLSIEGGDLNKAEKMAAKVVQEYPDNPTYLDTYAWILYLRGDYILAKFYQQRAIDKSDGDLSDDLLKHWDLILKALEE
ncbi:MAG: hypothetical protein KBT20_04620 [Bacteroidales bacterium]|nr:hypothetical protein [Candidatus Liminaster caballi]